MEVVIALAMVVGVFAIVVGMGLLRRRNRREKRAERQNDRIDLFGTRRD